MKKITATCILVLGVSAMGSACPLCNKQIRDEIYNSQFYPNLFIMLSAFIVLALIVVVLTILSTKRHRTRLATNPDVKLLSPVPLTTTSIVLGMGMGGFMDGIVLHQIVQTHNMLSNKIPATNYVGKSVNMFWDGIFHFFCMLVVLVGIFLMWKLLYRKDLDRSGKLLSGGLLMGWGLFNIVEGISDHHLLALHNVNELSHNPDIGNYGFLGISVIMLIAGYLLINNRVKQHITKADVM